MAPVGRGNLFPYFMLLVDLEQYESTREGNNPSRRCEFARTQEVPMHHAMNPSHTHSVSLITGLTSRLFRFSVRRKLVCFALIFNILMWPGDAFTLQQVSVLGSAVSSSVSTLVTAPLRISDAIFKWMFGPTALLRQTETLQERTARVSSIRLSPPRFVAYVNENVTFTALGTDINGETVHGAKYTWESSDTDKAQIDEAGRATLLQPGMVQITCRAGSAQATARVLVRPNHRPRQTDEQWRADQDGVDSVTGQTGATGAISSVLDRLAPTVSAQTGYGGDFGNSNNQVGTPPFRLLEPTRLGSVLGTTNFELAMPIADLGGRGLATNLTLYYNSSVWGTRIDPNQNYATVYTFDPIQSWPGPGFSLGFGRIVYHSTFLDPVTSESKCSYMLVDPNGTRHNLGIGLASGSNILKTTDGTRLTYVGDINGGNLYYNDGTKVTFSLVNNRRLATQITDTNGNYIQIAYKWSGAGYSPLAIDYVIDTLGRVIQFNYNSNTGLDLTSVSAPGGGALSLSYQSVSLYKNFQTSEGGPAQVENAPTSFNAIKTVGSIHSYQFTYSNWGMIYNISIDGGSANMSFDYPLGAPYEELSSIPQFTQRTESPNAIYTYDYISAGGVVQPDGTVLVLGDGAQELKSSTGVSLSKTIYTTTADPGGSAAIQSIVNYNDIGQPTKVSFDYDQYGNVVNKREYGFQVNGTWPVRRRTHYTYWNSQAYIDAYIRDRVLMVEVYDALQNTNDADDILIGKSVVGYDAGSFENYGGNAAPPGHLASYNNNTVRGNVTGITKWTDLANNTSVTKSNSRDIFGNIVQADVSCCSQKKYTLGQNTYWSRPEQIISGNPNGLHLTSTAGYDFNTLAEMSETDPNNQTTSYNYDSHLNPTGFISPTGVSGSAGYNSWGKPASSNITYSEGGGNKTIGTSAGYDAWGQMTYSIDANGAQTNYGYDNMGRMISMTNPFPQGGTPGPTTKYQYDQLGRVTITTLPGGSTTRVDFSGSIITLTDQVGRKVKRESDGLGRLVKVTEPNTAGALTQETTYTYDVADNLTQVNQGGQTRSYKYDTAGRLLYEQIPEQQATINDGTGTLWSCKYTYTDWDAIATKTDARGVVITYGYDNLHRLTSVSYNTANAGGVASTANVTYTYDTNNNSTTKGLLLSLSIGNSYSESYGYDSYNRLSSVTRTIDGRSYTTGYQLNTANQLTQMTYPSTRVINLGHDSRGRLTSAGAFLSGVTYNNIGQLTGISLGNGVSESYGYDANRMQLTSQTATAPGGVAGGLMNLTYGYQASAGQNGAGTTAGNAGQLMSISGTVNGATESANFTYDLLGRLVTSSQTSNGVSAQRRFDYDRWGNRTGVWDAVSGATQIQSITLQQSGGSPTNRISTVSNQGTVKNYTYDAAGNVTNDGTHAYGYDAENRLVSVDAGTTASYGYDQKNRRVKKVAAAATTHYVWEDSQVIAEHNGSTGAAIVDYIYSGNRMIAQVQGGSTQYFLSDRLSVRLTLNASGSVLGKQAHLPFGEDFAQSGVQEKHHFTNYERDSESGSDYAINRQYVQTTGKFLQSDPYQASSEPEDPQSWNKYSYSGSDPVNYVDPTGLERCAFFITPRGQQLRGFYPNAFFGTTAGPVNPNRTPGLYVYLVEMIISFTDITEPFSTFGIKLNYDFSYDYQHKKKAKKKKIDVDTIVTDLSGSVQWYYTARQTGPNTWDLTAFIYLPVVVNKQYRFNDKYIMTRGSSRFLYEARAGGTSGAYSCSTAFSLVFSIGVGQSVPNWVFLGPT